MSALPLPEPAPGALLLSEIREQPAALERLLEHSAEYAAVAAVARDRGLDLVRMVGHGSSDNAASYGVYAFGLLPRWTALRDSISLSVYYGAEIDLRGSCIVALSQSGETPDVLAYVERARARGALTIAITNDPESALGEAAERCCRSRPGRSARSRRRRRTRPRSRRSRSSPAHAAGRGPADRRRHPRRRGAARRRAAGARAAAGRGRGRLRVRRPDVRDRPRPRVRDRARDLAEAARDVPRRGRAADGHRPRARPGRRARRPLPGLDDRLRRREPACRARGRCARSRRRRDAGRERAGGPPDRRRRLLGAGPEAAP